MKKLLYIAFIAPFISQAIHACDVCAAQMEIGDTSGSTALSPIGRERGTYSSAVARANPAYSSNPTIAPDQPTRSIGLSAAGQTQPAYRGVGSGQVTSPEGSDGDDYGDDTETKKTKKSKHKRSMHHTM